MPGRIIDETARLAGTAAFQAQGKSARETQFMLIAHHRRNEFPLGRVSRSFRSVADTLMILKPGLRASISKLAVRCI